MSKYIKQNRLDERAISVISDYFMNKHGDRFDLQFHGIKDSTPDTDGFLRLREPYQGKQMQGKYLNQVVFFQLKGREKPITDDVFKCSRRLIDFCKEINLPTILFVVANINEKSEKQNNPQLYWYHFSNVNIEILNKINKGTSGYLNIPNLNYLKVGKSDFVDQFYIYIKNLAKRNEFLDLPKEILDIVIELKNKILVVASIIYLVGRVTRSECGAIAKMIKVTNRQMTDILSSLYAQKLIYKNKDVYIFKLVIDDVKQNVGLALLYETINEIDLDKLFNLFSDHRQTSQIYKNLAEVHHPVVLEYLDKKVDKIIEYVKK